jgi:hypothetical protein
MARFTGFAEAPVPLVGAKLKRLRQASTALARAPHTGAGELLLREEALTLKVARKALLKAGVAATLRNRELVAEGGTVLRVAPPGVKGSVGRVVVEGFLGEEYLTVQAALYSLYTRV